MTEYHHICECGECCARRKAARLDALGLEEYRNQEANADELEQIDEEWNEEEENV